MSREANAPGRRLAAPARLPPSPLMPAHAGIQFLVLGPRLRGDERHYNYEQPVVEPQVSHFRQVPLRTSVKFWHSAQASPS